MAASSFAEPGFTQARVQHLTQDLDLSQDTLARVLDLAAQIKRTPQRFAQALAGRYISLLFEKPSLRTRITFELAIKQLGGDSVTSVGPDRRARAGQRRGPQSGSLDPGHRRAHLLAGRPSRNWPSGRSVPVINALSDLYHPCQALADMLTIKEHFGDCDGLKLAFVGDGNNVAHSLMLTAARLGMNFAVATPAATSRTPEIVAQASRSAVRHQPVTERSCWKPSTARTPSTPTCGPAWARKREADERARSVPALPGERER